MRLIILLLLAFSLSSCRGQKRPCDVFLLIGQSNMAGRGVMIRGDSVEMKGVWLLDGEGVPQKASNPLNKFSSIRKSLEMQQIGPGYSFARTLREATDRDILLVVNARGGSSILEWTVGGRFYDEAVRRSRQAMEHGRLVAILWHQGESDSSDPSGYMEALSTIVSAMRTDIDSPEVPFVAGEIARWHKNASKFNSVINTVPQYIPRSGVVSSEGASPLIDHDDPHFSREGQLLLGERYARKVLEMCYSE